MQAAKQTDAGHGAKQHAHQHRNKGQQHAPAAKREQQQEQNPEGGPAAYPGDLTGGLLLAAGGVEQATGGEQLHVLAGGLFAAVLNQCGHLQGQLHVKGITLRAGAQQYPTVAVGISDQGAAADVQLHRAALRLAVLDAPGQAQPVVLAGHQAKAAERVEQRLHPLLDKGVWVFDQLCAVSLREHCQAPAQQLLAQGGQVGLQVPLDLFKQPAGQPLLAQLASSGNGLLAISAAHQQQHLSVEGFLHALLGAL